LIPCDEFLWGNGLGFVAGIGQWREVSVLRDHIIRMGCNGTICEGVIIRIVIDDPKLEVRADGIRFPDISTTFKNCERVAQDAAPALLRMISAYSVRIRFETAQSISPKAKPSSNTP
jgi:hypothetical protein